MKSIYKWLIAWGVMCLLMISGTAKDRNLKETLRTIGGGTVILGIGALVHYSKTPCPGCGKRWAGEQWDHERKDGEADLRYKDNKQRCKVCRFVRATV